MRPLVFLFLAACHSAPVPAPPPPVVEPARAPAATAPVVAPAASAAPVVDAYDLAADREARLASARSELGGKTSSAVIGESFVVVGTPGGSWGASVTLMRNAMTALLNERFEHRPEKAITVYLLPDAASYEALCQKKYGAPCIAHFGFYQPGDRAMIMNIGLGIGTLTHELVHPLVEADFPEAPTWINEGIASVFEQPVLPRKGEIHGAKNWRLPRLRSGLAAKQIRLDQLFTMGDETFRGPREDLHYAAARYVCQWLDEQEKLWPFFRKWRASHATDPTGAKTFAEVVGMTPEDAHAPWARWVAGL